MKRNDLWKRALGAVLCLCLWGSSSRSPAQSSNQQVFITWSCQVTGSWRDIVGRHGDRPNRQIEKRLIAALRNKNSQVRKDAAIALGQFKVVRAVKPLVATLRDREPIVRACAGSSLVKIGPAAVVPLISLLKDKDLFVPALSAASLSAIHDSQARQALMNALSEHNSQAILGAHALYLRLGVQGSESALIETLTKFPNRQMAEEFQNSGNPMLQSASAAWAHKYKQKLAPPRYLDAVRWGSGEGAPPPGMTAANSGEGH